MYVINVFRDISGYIVPVPHECVLGLLACNGFQSRPWGEVHRSSSDRATNLVRATYPYRKCVQELRQHPWLLLVRLVIWVSPYIAQN